MNEATLEKPAEVAEKPEVYEELDIETFRLVLDQFGIQLTDRPLTETEILQVLPLINDVAKKQHKEPLRVMYYWLDSLRKYPNPIIALEQLEAQKRSL